MKNYVKVKLFQWKILWEVSMNIKDNHWQKNHGTEFSKEISI